MIVYEVNLHIDAIAADEYSEWLGPHIEQILDVEGFQKAEWFVCDSDDDKVHWSIRYHLDSRESLVNYQKNHIYLNLLQISFYRHKFDFHQFQLK